jgi:hypothetical protein
MGRGQLINYVVCVACNIATQLKEPPKRGQGIILKFWGGESAVRVVAETDED